MTPPPGFSTSPQIPNNTTVERSPMINTLFATTTLENTSFAYCASTSTNPNPMISPTFVEANYEVLDSLLTEQQRHIRNEDLRTKLEYFSEDYDEVREMEPRPEPNQEATTTLRPRRGRNAKGIRPLEIEDENKRANLPHSWWLTWEGTSLHTPTGLVPIHVNPYSQPSVGLVNGETPNFPFQAHIGNPHTGGIFAYHPQGAKEVHEETLDGSQHQSKRRENFERSRKSYRDDNRGQKDKDRFSPYCGPIHGVLSTLSEIPREILDTEKAARIFEQPPHMFESRWSRDKTKGGSEIRTSGLPGKRSKKNGKISDAQLGKWKKREKDATPVEAPVLMIRREGYNPRKRPVEGNNSKVGEIMFPPLRNISSADPVIINAYVSGRQVNMVYLDGGTSCQATANKNQKKVTTPPEDLRRRLRMDYCTHDGSPKNSNNSRRNLQHRAQNKRAQTLGTSKAEKEKSSVKKKQSDLHPSEGAYKSQHFTRSQVSDVGLKPCHGEKGQWKMEGDIVIKSDIKEEMLADIKETLDGLRAINLKLNLKKCSFGIKHFLLCEHLKAAQVKKMVQWTREADEAFRRMKELLEALPMYISDKPIKQILARPEKSRRIAKWAIELGEHEIEFRGRNSVKGQILANFLAETPSKEEERAKDKEAKRKNLEPKKAWKLFTDGASSSNGSEAGLIQVIPEGKEYTYTLRFEFKTTNNEAEYEALLAGVRIAKEMRVQELTIFVDS
nr:reverse transcriptase domain-containing protein [Tanacetum cinerariifolium]